MSELEFDWSELASSSNVWTEKKPVISNVRTWRSHRCDSSHKTADTFLRCALRKYSPNNSGKLTLSQVSTQGYGDWAVIHQSYSGDYFTTHNGRRLNHGHTVVDVIFYETLERADEIHKMATKLCSTNRCVDQCMGTLPNIVRVSL